MTLFGRNILVGSVDLVFSYSSLLIVLVRLDQLLLLLDQCCLIALQLSVLRLEVLDVLEVLVDEPYRKEHADPHKDP